MHTKFTLTHTVKDIIMSWIKDQSLSEKVIVLQSWLMLHSVSERNGFDQMKKLQAWQVRGSNILFHKWAALLFLIFLQIVCHVHMKQLTLKKNHLNFFPWRSGVAHLFPPFSPPHSEQLLLPQHRHLGLLAPKCQTLIYGPPQNYLGFPPVYSSLQHFFIYASKSSSEAWNKISCNGDLRNAEGAQKFTLVLLSEWWWTPLFGKHLLDRPLSTLLACGKPFKTF